MRLLCQGTLIFVAVLAASAAAAAQGRPNQFPVLVSAEAFTEEPNQVHIEFPFYFPVDLLRYRPIDSELARMLSLPPEVESPDGLRTRVAGVECSPGLLEISNGGQRVHVEGARMSVDLVVMPGDSLLPGEHAVVLRFPQIDYVFELLGTQPRPAPARAHVELMVWSSREAKAEAERRAAEERRRRRRVAIRRTFDVSLYLLAGLALVAVPYRWFRPWIRPAADVELPSGGHVQVNGALPARRQDRRREAGTILRTLWARDSLGRRRPIKVETLKTEDGEAARLELLVSVGTSVSAGTYGARGPNGAVRVRVR